MRAKEAAPRPAAEAPFFTVPLAMREKRPIADELPGRRRGPNRASPEVGAADLNDEPTRTDEVDPAPFSELPATSG